MDMQNTEIIFSLDSDKTNTVNRALAMTSYGLEPELTKVNGKRLIDWTGS